MRIPFRKMHGLGNDFVVIDARGDDIRIGAAAARVLADRHPGIGCDQLILIEAPRQPSAQAFMRILNADGSEAEACGNGARCIARLIAEETGGTRVRIETLGGLLDAELLAEVYIELIGARQTTLILVENGTAQDRTPQQIAASRVRPQPLATRVTEDELGAHHSFIATLGEAALWNGYRPIVVPKEAKEQAASDQETGATLP